jgi:hypothetical protein
MTTLYIEYPGAYRAPIIHAHPPRCRAYHVSRIDPVEVEDVERWRLLRRAEECPFCIPLEVSP